MWLCRRFVSSSVLCTATHFAWVTSAHLQTIDFVGHAIALHQNDAYMMQVWGGRGKLLRVLACGLQCCSFHARGTS